MALRTGYGTGAGEPRIEVLSAVAPRAANADETAANLAALRVRAGQPLHGCGQMQSYLPAQAADVRAVRIRS